MIVINNIHLPLDNFPEDFKEIAAAELKISPQKIKEATLYRRSVDARKKDNVHFCCSVAVKVTADEQSVIKRSKKAAILNEEKYIWQKNINSSVRPVVVGFGPAGMFAALCLARAGLKPIVIERGECVEKRTESVKRFFEGGNLNPESNVQFGEGGAGTFSDGKLGSGIKNIRCRAVLEEFVRFGADKKILTDAKPHVGTDCLVNIVKNLRNEVIGLGGEILFCHRFCGINYKDLKMAEIEVESCDGIKKIPCERLILATGHSARDVFFMLKDMGIRMERKPFSVGARIEHKRRDIDSALYGEFAAHPALGAADYKLAVHLENGKGVYTFCMCPGGEVINASSEAGGIAVNGMSLSHRNAENSNSAVLVDIKPEELSGDDVLEGVYLQREIEQKAFSIANGAVPTETLGGALSANPTVPSYVMPSVKPYTVLCDIRDVLPSSVCDSLLSGITLFDKKIKGFANPLAVLTFPETRSSSPVRILRRDDGQSISLEGLFPCGEGAGYAGGIMSAAVDGIKTAEKVIDSLI